MTLPGTENVSAVMFAFQNMNEETLFKMQPFRDKMSALGVALVWIAPGFGQEWDVRTGVQTAFDDMLVALAEKKSKCPRPASPRNDMQLPGYIIRKASAGRRRASHHSYSPIIISPGMPSIFRLRPHVYWDFNKAHSMTKLNPGEICEADVTGVISPETSKHPKAFMTLPAIHIRPLSSVPVCRLYFGCVPTRHCCVRSRRDWCAVRRRGTRLYIESFRGSMLRSSTA